MTPDELNKFLRTLIQIDNKDSTMIWGPPGIGKSSVVKQVVASYNRGALSSGGSSDEEQGQVPSEQMGFVDLRISQLAPTDLRGLPVADKETKSAQWYPPNFLPRSGRGILFLDEINMAPPAVQGIAQQLVLDREVGDYKVPDGWFIWAAGNRKEDRAATFDVPAPVANRFIHVTVEPHLPSFLAYGTAVGLHEHIQAFLQFRPALLHKLNAQSPTWPSPRSWFMADRLYKGKLPVQPAVGEAGNEFDSYVEIYTSGKLPDIDAILSGKGAKIKFPEEPSIRYATITALYLRLEKDKAVQQALAGYEWISSNAGPEWEQVYASQVMQKLQAMGLKGTFVIALRANPELAQRLLKAVAVSQGK